MGKPYPSRKRARAKVAKRRRGQRDRFFIRAIQAATRRRN